MRPSSILHSMRAAVAALAALALAAAVAPAAVADGDPASDVLYAANAYVPYPSPSADAVAGLQAQIAAVYAHGDRVGESLDDVGGLFDAGGGPLEWVITVQP